MDNILIVIDIKRNVEEGVEENRYDINIYNMNT